MDTAYRLVISHRNILHYLFLRNFWHWHFHYELDFCSEWRVVCAFCLASSNNFLCCQRFGFRKSPVHRFIRLSHCSLVFLSCRIKQAIRTLLSHQQ